jgi:hypothetical protein
MGYVEMLKIDRETGLRYIVYFDGDSDIKRENARKCDICYAYKRESQVMTVFIGNTDDWLELCQDCRVDS